MKRIIIIAALFGFCIGISIYTVCAVEKINTTMDQYVEQALYDIEQADEDQLKTHVDILSEYWHKKEEQLIPLVRHAQIDEITKSVSRLQALTSGRDYAELAAELSSIRWQIDHIHRSEKIRFRNVL